MIKNNFFEIILFKKFFIKLDFLYFSINQGFYSEVGNQKNNLIEEEEKNIDIIKYKRSQTNVLATKESVETAVCKTPSNPDDFYIDFKNIFGELLDDQAERIRKCSPFRSFKTWKICKIIGKNFF